jgi:hypothetical protein
LKQVIPGDASGIGGDFHWMRSVVRSFAKKNPVSRSLFRDQPENSLLLSLRVRRSNQKPGFCNSNGSTADDVSIARRLFLSIRTVYNSIVRKIISTSTDAASAVALPANSQTLKW